MLVAADRQISPKSLEQTDQDSDLYHQQINIQEVTCLEIDVWIFRLTRHEQERTRTYIL